MGDFDLSSFISNFAGKGGARQYLFSYSPIFPTGISNNINNTKYKYMVKATNFPESTTEEIVMNWMGMDKKVSGKQTFTDWTVTLMVDNIYDIRNSFELWMQQQNTVYGINGLSKYGTPGVTTGTTTITGYVANQTLFTLDYNLSSAGQLKVELYNAWPKSVGPITLDYSAQDVSQFDVTFTYDWHIISEVATS